MTSPTRRATSSVAKLKIPASGMMARKLTTKMARGLIPLMKCRAMPTGTATSSQLMVYQ